MKKPLLAILYNLLCYCCLAQTASFTYQSANGLYCNPATVNFTQTCSGSPAGFFWTFGNGQSSNQANPSIVFSVAGSYTVKLVAIYDRVAVETSQTIVINPSFSTSLTADKNYICTPGTINFTAAATGSINTYEWNFGDGNTTVTSGSSIPHAYTAFGSYGVTVKATDFAGCFATAAYNINVSKPAMSGTVTPTSGCIPASVNYTAAAVLPAGSTITNYSWDFGDGNTASGTAGSISHPYAVVGSYSPSVSITTGEGCTNTFNYPVVAFGTPPTGLTASSDKTVYCGSETPQFTASATNANSYKWDFGDGNTATVNTNTTSHKYTTLGTKTVSVIPYFNGCAGTSASFTIDIVGVIAGFTYGNTCSDKKTFSFVNTSQGNQSTITWDFGDGSPSVSSTNATHTYPASGSFLTSLYITDNITGCTDRKTVTIYTASIKVTNPDIAICRNSMTSFTIEDNYTNTGASYEWHTVGLPAITNGSNPYSVKATVLGNFSSDFVVVDNGTQYCPDTTYLSHAILVRGPDLSYTMPASICANEKLHITNTSKAYLPQDTVRYWYWNYDFSPANDSSYQPVPVQFPRAGDYSVKLVAGDNKGCRDSLVKIIYVNAIPFLRIIPRDDTLCLGQSDTLIAYHNGTITWSPAAALSCSSCDTTIASPSVTTLFHALATNNLGCSVQDSALVKVYTPFTATAVKNPVYICQGETVQISADPPGKVIRWSPAAGLSDTTIYNTIAAPSSGTTYTALLTDSVGCFSSTTSVMVNVKTTPTVNAGPDLVLPYMNPFTITPVYSSNVAQYLWTPAGTLDCVSCPSPSGTAAEGITYTVKVTSDSGCVARDDINILVACQYAYLLMPTAFSPNRDGKNDYYFPLTRGISLIKKFIIYDRYGQKVFEAQHFRPNEKTYGWDGRYRGQLNTPGNYIYVLEALCETGQTLQKNGSFILLK